MAQGREQKIKRGKAKQDQATSGGVGPLTSQECTAYCLLNNLASLSYLGLLFQLFDTMRQELTQQFE